MSTGPRTEEDKRQSRRKAFRHGLTAETVIEILDDIDDYQAFEATIIADYDAHTAVERELVLRLASLLWRIRRATSIETDLLRIQAEPSKQSSKLLSFISTRELRGESRLIWSGTSAGRLRRHRFDGLDVPKGR